MAQVPIIVVHKGGKKYLRDCLKCAADYGCEIVLIGDLSNQKFAKNWVDCAEYESSCFRQMNEIYRHMSSNSVEFELICIQRYFYVHEYMRKHHLNNCVMIDSDTLVYAPLESADLPMGISMASSWYERQETYRWAVCPHYTYWTFEGLDDFVRFCIYSYSTEEGLRPLREKYDFHLRNQRPGGICDMTLLYLWIHSTRLHVFNFSTIEDGDIVDYDMSVSLIGNVKYQMNEKWGMKEVVFCGCVPHFKRWASGKLVSVRAIHAWGDKKKYMGTLRRGHYGEFWFYLAKAENKILNIKRRLQSR